MKKVKRRTLDKKSLPRGVSICSKDPTKYVARRKGKYLGIFDSPEKAYQAYLKSIAEEKKEGGNFWSL